MANIAHRASGIFTLLISLVVSTFAYAGNADLGYQADSRNSLVYDVGFHSAWVADGTAMILGGDGDNTVFLTKFAAVPLNAGWNQTPRSNWRETQIRHEQAARQFERTAVDTVLTESNRYRAPDPGRSSL